MNKFKSKSRFEKNLNPKYNKKNIEMFYSLLLSCLSLRSGVRLNTFKRIDKFKLSL